LTLRVLLRLPWILTLLPALTTPLLVMLPTLTVSAPPACTAPGFWL